MASTTTIRMATPWSKAGVQAFEDIVRRAWIWLVAGIAAGALINGHVPATLLAQIVRHAGWSVPAAVPPGNRSQPTGSP